MLASFSLLRLMRFGWVAENALVENRIIQPIVVHDREDKCWKKIYCSLSWEPLRELKRDVYGGWIEM